MSVVDGLRLVRGVQQLRVLVVGRVAADGVLIVFRDLTVRFILFGERVQSVVARGRVVVGRLFTRCERLVRLLLLLAKVTMAPP